MKTALRWILLIGLGIVIVGAAVYALWPQPIPVDIASAERKPMQWTVDEEGQTRIRERYVVSAPLTGRLRRISLDAGDTVRADDTVLATLEPTDPELLDPRAEAQAEARVRAAEATVRQATAQLERAQADYEFASNELERIIDASEQGASSPREMDKAVTDEARAKGELEAARHAREIAEFELEVARSALLFARGADGDEGRAHMSLRSPIDGAVLRVLQESVVVVTPGTPLIEVGDPRDLEIVVDVLSTDAVKIRPGNRVIVEQWGGDEPLEAVVRLVEPSGFTKISALGIEEQRVNVIADFITPAAQRDTLGDGFRVEVSIVVWQADDVLQVPTSAAFRRGDEWVVFKVNEGAAHLQQVKIGRQTGQTIQILSGLSQGDRVIVHPNDQIEDGIRVIDRGQ